MKYHGLKFGVAALAVLLASCSSGEKTGETPNKVEASAETGIAASVNTDRIINAAKTPEEWLSYGGGYEEQRHSLLTQINEETLKDVGAAWTYDLQTHRGVEATPIVVDGVMYVTGAWSIVYALDARTGEELWVHDPEVPGETAFKACCDIINRGVAVYEGKVFVGTLDGRLQALDAKTGKQLWSKVTVDQSKPYTITGAPRVAKGKVFIGNGGAELGVRGYLSAYDIETGEMEWRFYTAPNPNKKPDGAASDDIMAKLANATWGDDGAWVTDGGGGTVWDSIVYDSVNNSIIFGVGNSSPWNSKVRDPNSDGDNLFVSSIVSVDVETGEYNWHFQTTPRDNWDYTATQSIIIADLPVGEDGADKRVVMQAPKNGFYYVLDAASGEFISGNNFVPMTWATGLDENGRPIENPAARQTENGFASLPGPTGAHNWHPMAYSPKTKLAYIPTQLVPLIYKDFGDDIEGRVILNNTGYDLTADSPLAYPAGTIDFIRSQSKGFLTAWDPIKQEVAWQKPLDGMYNSGILSTEAGLIFQGNVKGEFFAYDAASGNEVWKTDIKGGLMAAPSTYELDGEQYIAIATGWGGSFALTNSLDLKSPVPPAVGRVISFKIGGEVEIEDPIYAAVKRTPKASAFGDEELIVKGAGIYNDACWSCHGGLAVSGGVIPDLRWSQITGDKELFREVVIDGILKDNGMVGFADNLDMADAEAIRAFLLNQAHMAVANGEADVLVAE
ncbi:MAG: PQQ-dependent dehydrogenase, methanol/ethanol family [Maricaulaceae bacterium]